MERIHKKRTLPLVIGLLTLAFFLLFPGLRGTFIFDDFGNLQALATLAQSADSLGFIFDSQSGPLGRPVAMATFWLQSACWPDTPWCFKTVNLALHLINGALLFSVIICIARIAGRADAKILAFTVTALWLLHPIHASTVFYVVQRMNLLAATFTLLGVLTYLRARQNCVEGNVRLAALQYWLLFPFALILAAFSKENGLLLVAYVAAIELVLPPTVSNKQHTFWRTTFIIAPIILVLTTLTLFWEELVLRGYSNRPFTFEERVLTQGRVMMDYFLSITAPTGTRIGLFNENYPLSNGLLNPISTLFSFLALSIATSLTFVFRKRVPPLALGCLWFLVGHAMESTVFPVEIYFEHRNYLPAAGIVLALASIATLLYEKLHSKVLCRVTLAMFILYGVYVALSGHMEARLWGDPVRQAVVWVEENPDSPRTQIYLNNVLFALGNKDAAVEHFEYMASHLEDPLIAWMSWLEARCTHDKIKEPPYKEMATALRNTQYSIRPTNTITHIVTEKLDKRCDAVEPGVVRDLTVALLENPAFAPRKLLLTRTLARIEALDSNFDKAAELTETLYRTRPEAALALQIAAWHINAGNSSAARQWLDQAVADNADTPAESRKFSEDFRYLEKRLALLSEQEGT